MSNFHRLTIALILINLLLPGLVRAATYQPLKIEPSRFVFAGEPGEQITGAIVVRHTGQQPTTPQALLSDWTLNSQNELILLEAGSLDSTLHGWIKFNPRRFQLTPNSSQTVRFTIKIPPDAPAGERRGMIAFEQSIPFEESGIGATARVQVTSTIYVAVLPVERHVDITGLRILTDTDPPQNPQLEIEVLGTGNAHYRGNGFFDILPPDDEDPLASGVFPPLIVMPGVSGNFRGVLAEPLSPGQYRLSIEISPEDTTAMPLHRIYNFAVPAKEN